MTAKRNTNFVASAAVLGVCLAIGLILLGYFLAAAVMESRRGDRTVSVQGEASQVIAATAAVWTLAFAVQSNDVSALGEKTQVATGDVQKFLLAQGFTESEIFSLPPVLCPPEKSPALASSSSPVWWAQGAFIVRTKSIDKVRSALVAAGEVFLDGVQMVAPSAEPEFIFEIPDATLAELWKAADQSAYRAAQRFGDHTGQAIGGLRQAEQMPLEVITLPPSLAGQQKVQATTRAEYFLR